MKIKIALAVVLVLSVVLSACACSATDNSVLSSDKAWTYLENEDKTITLLSYNGNDEVVTVPEKVDDKTVSALGEKIFVNINDGSVKKGYKGVYEKNTTLKKVVIEAAIKSIPNMAFYLCTELNDVVFTSKTVEMLCDFSFYGCSKLASITLPKSCSSIGNYCFRECTSLSVVYMLYNSDTTISIGDKAFYNVDQSRDSDDQYYIIPGIKLYVNNISLYNVEVLEALRKETKNNSYKYWQEYVKADCVIGMEA